MPSKSHSVYFEAPGKVSIKSRQLAAPSENEIQIKTRISAISPGTELLVYQGKAPQDLPVDDTIGSLSGNFSFPIKYGYALAGDVIQHGSLVDQAWLGRQVFVFHPHESLLNIPLESAIPLPEGLEVDDAVFLPNMETAVNFLMDGRPIIGENVVVFGQGIVGLLTTALLADFHLNTLITLDRHHIRRQASLRLGAQASFDPTNPESHDQIRQLIGVTERYQGADLIYELSGAPEALNQAIPLTGFGGRIIVGSWYGQKQTEINLGGHFHRARIQLISSQVSSLAPSFRGRWSKTRRLETAQKALAFVRPSQFITHRFPIHEAAEAYQLLECHPEETIQIIFDYD